MRLVPQKESHGRGVRADLLGQFADPAADLAIRGQCLPVVAADARIVDEAGQSRLADLVEIGGAAKARNVQAGIAHAFQLCRI